MRRTLVLCKELFMYLFSWTIAHFMPKENDLWLIAERHDEARDNGYFFYKFLMQEHKNINSCYAIDEGAHDEKKIIELGGRHIRFGSLEHYCLYHKAHVLLSTHIYGYAPSRPICSRLDKYCNKNKIRVFLQHGIIMNFHPADMYESNNISLYICSAKREHDFLMKVNHYPESVMCLSGMARYDDLLLLNNKRQILIMPTWRAYLSRLTEKEFVKSDYYLAFMKLINSREINELLSKYNYNLIFYPHYEMQKFIHLFHNTNDKVIIAQHDIYDVHELLRDSKILITDYSSVHFDFAYMKKPIIYYQFDVNEFYGEHYTKGYYDFINDGFGPVYTNCNDVIEYLKNLIAGKMSMQDNYIYRVNQFYEYHDQRNSERIYKRIRSQYRSC